MGFSYLKSRVLQVHPYSTLCLNKIVSHIHHYLVENAITPMNATSYMVNRFHVLSSVTCFYGLKHVKSCLLLGCGRRFYHSNRYPVQDYIARTSCWQWLRTHKYGFIKTCIIFTLLFASFERVPYSNRIHSVTSLDQLERWVGQHQWEREEEEYQGRILAATHPLSVRVKSILREIVQGMHTGLDLKRDCNVSGYGSEGTLFVSRVNQECQKRAKKFIIKFGTKHLEGLDWEVRVVQSYKRNAMYFSYGKIVIYTGMLDFCNLDAEMAYVLGHEVGHGVARHAIEGLMRILWIFALILWPLRRLMILSFVAQPVYKYFSRRDEVEADYIGLMLMASAGYDPQAAPKFQEREDSEEDWLSTHPSGERRARSMNKNKVMGEALAIYKEVRSGHGVKGFV